MYINRMHGFGAAGAAIAALLLGGCVGKRLATELPNLPLDMTSLGSVVASPRNSIVAVGGSQQLGAVGTAYDGSAVTTFDSLVFQLSTLADTTKVTLSATGLVTGRSAAAVSPAFVNVIAFRRDIPRGDQVLVQVTPAVIPGVTLSIRPVAPDSAKLSSGTKKTIVPVIRNPVTGGSVTSPAALYDIQATDSALIGIYQNTISYFSTLTDRSSNNAYQIRSGNAGGVTAVNQIVALQGEGAAWVYATVNAYGTLLRDSVQYTLSYPYVVTISTVKANLALYSVYNGMNVTLAPGATVTFQNGVAATDPLTVAYTFDTPAAATVATPASTNGGSTGNIAALIGGQTSARRFLTPGTYHWTATGAGGSAPWPGQTLHGTLTIK